MYHQHMRHAQCNPQQENRRNISKGYPRVNIQKNENGYDLFIAVPGFEKKDLVLEMDKSILKITGKIEKTENTEFQYQGFGMRPFTLNYEIGENMDIEKINASHSNGILSVHIPFKEKSPAININIQ